MINTYHIMVDALPLVVMKQKTKDVHYWVNGNEVFPISKNINGFAKIFPVKEL